MAKMAAPPLTGATVKMNWDTFWPFSRIYDRISYSLHINNPLPEKNSQVWQLPDLRKATYVYTTCSPSIALPLKTSLLSIFLNTRMYHVYCITQFTKLSVHHILKITKSHDFLPPGVSPLSDQNPNLSC